MTAWNSKPTSLSLRIAAGLLLGLAFGLFASVSGRPWLLDVAGHLTAAALVARGEGEAIG